VRRQKTLGTTWVRRRREMSSTKLQARQFIKRNFKICGDKGRGQGLSLRQTTIQPKQRDLDHLDRVKQREEMNRGVNFRWNAQIPRSTTELR